jgi:diguanylate cyclase (GGDEF)-like protein/PAS domain S-box-containing protein
LVDDESTAAGTKSGVSTSLEVLDVEGSRSARKPVRVLLVEDSEDDAKLVLQALRRGGFRPTSRRVQTEADLETALSEDSWDVVISDFRMPSFTGLDALRIFRSTGLDLPFILISGTIGEETAVDAMKAGASDYIMKKNLARLPPALERELKDARHREAHRRNQKILAESEERFRQMADNIRDVFFLIDARTHRLLYVSPACEEIWGCTGQGPQAEEESWANTIHPDDRVSTFEKYKAGMSTGTFDCEYRIVRPDGAFRWVEMRGFPVRNAAGGIVRIAGIAEDITQRKHGEDRIKRLSRLYAVLSGINTLIVRVRDRDELFREACQVAVDEGGFRMAWVGIVDRSIQKVVPIAAAGPDNELLDAIKGRISSSDSGTLGSNIATRAIVTKEAAVSNDLERDPQVVLRKLHLDCGIRSLVMLPLIVSGEAVGVFALYSTEVGFFDEKELKLLNELAGDIAFAIDHIEKQERLDYLAYYDALTRLANRTLFLERVSQYLRGAIGAAHGIAVVVIDLERFKNINDSLGQVAGDALLRQVAEWLIRYAEDATLLARVGADHFAMVLPKLTQADAAVRFVEKMHEAFLEHPFRLTDAVFHISATIGIAVFPDGGTDAAALFRNAEAALKKAKTSGERYLVYTGRMTEMVAGRLTMENKLRQALEREEFVLHFQPKMSLTSGKLTGVEALIRWNDPHTGLVLPERFIPILEETGLIHDVGRWALRKAIEEYLRWRAAGLPAVRIAVNVSALQLRTNQFIAELEQEIAISPHAAAGLELELTESLIMADVKHSIASLAAIRAMGLTVAIDDFGTGFSSLSYLARLPVDTLKIDRSFVVDMTSSPEGLSLVSTIINLAHSLKLTVVAEGVETEKQSHLLRLLGCDEMQGHLFSKPLAREIFEARFLAPAGREAI